ncbi:MAG: helix-turn-helix transcriptional regulator [bacterium]|nr:helix-turn-helix transcriptional regulator [bacterium]
MNKDDDIILPPLRKENRTYRPSIGRRLKEFRKHLGLTTVQMAAVFGITVNSYRKKEYGQTLAGLKSLNILGKTYGLSMDWLILGRGPMRFKDVGKEEEKVLEHEQKQQQLLETIEGQKNELSAMKDAHGKETTAIKEKHRQEKQEMISERNAFIRRMPPENLVSPELIEMLDYMDKHPSLHHKVLSYYYDLKEK